MPSLQDHHSSQFAKVLLIGDSGTGKTGSLVSLVAEGYKVRVLDLDNGLDSLVQWSRRICPDNLGNVDYETVRDSWRASNAGPVTKAEAFVKALRLLTKWSDDTVPAEWGDKTVLVIDSLSALGKAAFEWAKGMNPSAKDPRQWYFAAQQSIENIIAMLTDDKFQCNVVLISHVNYKEMADGTTKGYANTIGSALGPTIPKYLNCLLLAESSGSGANVKRVIRTMPTGVIELKTPKPFSIPNTLPLDTGMAEIFRQLKAA